MRKKARRRNPAAKPLLTGLRPGLRMRGGIRSNPDGPGYFAIVHVWDNPQGRGAPDEWRFGEVFATDEEAMAFYVNNIRPELERMTKEFAEEAADSRVVRSRSD